MISFEFKEWINEKVLEYLPKDGIRHGSVYNCRCPICGDSKKNSSKKRGYYFLDSSSYFCHNQCGSISGMKLLERLSGTDFESLKKEYMKMVYDGKHFSSISRLSCNNDNHQISLFNLTNIIKPEWKRPLSDKALKYLSDRRVLEAPFMKEKLYSYYAKNGNEYIMIPWIINGIECYFQLNDFLKHNTRGMKYIFPKNMEKMIYGLDNIDMSFPYIFMFEGVYDGLFVPNSIAIGGKYLTAKQSELLSKRYPNHKLVFALDNDVPGMREVAKNLKNINTINKYMYFKWFKDDTVEKDVNDYVLAKNNVNMFTDKKWVESCVVDPLIMKMWMISRGIFK